VGIVTPERRTVAAVAEPIGVTVCGVGIGSAATGTSAVGTTAESVRPMIGSTPHD
jgi:ribose 5-phosphate isomerase RpiB